jgi:hypothetical protein
MYDGTCTRSTIRRVGQLKEIDVLDGMSSSSSSLDVLEIIVSSSAFFAAAALAASDIDLVCVFLH